jgi:hypothetical protein
MRNFSEIEKEFIKYLISSDRKNRYIASFLDRDLDNILIKLDTKNKNGTIYFCTENPNENFFGWVIKKDEDLEELFAIIIYLVLYLEKNGYIALYDVTPNEFCEDKIFGRGIKSEVKNSIPFPDDKIVDYAINYFYKRIVPLEPLHELFKKNFITPDEYRFRKLYKQTRIGIGVAICIGLFGILLNIVSMSSNNSKIIQQDVKNINDQILEIEKIANNVNNQINQLRESLHKIEKSFDIYIKDRDQIKIRKKVVEKNSKK